MNCRDLKKRPQNILRHYKKYLYYNRSSLSLNATKKPSSICDYAYTGPYFHKCTSLYFYGLLPTPKTIFKYFFPTSPPLSFSPHALTTQQIFNTVSVPSKLETHISTPYSNHILSPTLCLTANQEFLKQTDILLLLQSTLPKIKKLPLHHQMPHKSLHKNQDVTPFCSHRNKLRFTYLNELHDFISVVPDTSVCLHVDCAPLKHRPPYLRFQNQTSIPYIPFHLLTQYSEMKSYEKS